MPLTVGNERIGLLQLHSTRRAFFTAEILQAYEAIAQILGIAVVHQQAQWALLERVKEMTCLYGIAHVAGQPGSSLEEFLSNVVNILPPAWQYPDSAVARIRLDGLAYETPDFCEGCPQQTADIVVRGTRRGTIEVAYSKTGPGRIGELFLEEERQLLENIARHVALVIERRDAEDERTTLHDQLRHADRLAAIGQLAAGVAHELNEPLNTILGFAQLATKDPTLSSGTANDLEKIIAASLHAREIIKKLSIFARRMPPTRTKLNINHLIDEGLYLFEPLCASEGIELKRLCDPSLPDIAGDSGQLLQVLTNLVVNAVQAMSGGGTLTIETHSGLESVTLIVEDTGSGMSEEVMNEIFMPFFTTKDVDEGTGLGLAVVHGIVSSHGGTIKVSSSIGKGSRFTVKLPLTGPGDDQEEITRAGERTDPRS
jgi:signal transduction histidine kinase